jgi:hypothetical protein
MLHRLVLAVAATFLIACAASSCNGGGGATPVPNPQDETRIILASGGGAIFPAGTFTVATEVDVNEELSGSQTSSAGYPDNSGALLGSTTVKVPAGVVLNEDIEVLIALSPAQPTNLAFTIFMFNATTGMWETTAAASAASKASAAVGLITRRCRQLHRGHIRHRGFEATTACSEHGGRGRAVVEATRFRR